MEQGLLFVHNISKWGNTQQNGVDSVLLGDIADVYGILSLDASWLTAKVPISSFFLLPSRPLFNPTKTLKALGLSIDPEIIQNK
jgi:hypothetical protein